MIAEIFRTYIAPLCKGFKVIIQNLQDINALNLRFMDSINKLEADVFSLRKRINELEGRIN